MKKILSIAALSMLSLSSLLTAPAQAATDASFNVGVTLTSKCEVTSAALPALSFTYVAFGSAVDATPITLTFRCTRGITPTVAFDTVGGTSSLTGATATGAGVVSGLRYTLDVAANTSGVAGAEPINGDIGSAKTLSYVVSGNMPANQAGLSTGSTPLGRSLIVSY